MNICGILYVIYYLEEVPQKIDPAIGGIELMNQNSSENSKMKNRFQKEKVKCSEIFNTNVIRDGLRVILRKRQYNGRTVVLLLFLMTIIYNGIFSGELAITYS